MYLNFAMFLKDIFITYLYIMVFVMHAGIKTWTNAIVFSAFISRPISLLQFLCSYLRYFSKDLKLVCSIQCQSHAVFFYLSSGVLYNEFEKQ
jgi:hypothetical protein